MAFIREKDVIFDLIEMYKNMPFLWNKNHIDYKNQARRTHANKLLLEVYQKIDENASVHTMNKKIHNLRTSYFKELRKVNEAQELNKPVYEPKLWYYKAMTFLGDGDKTSDCCHMDPLKTEKISSLNSDGDDSYQDSETYATPLLQKRKIKNLKVRDTLTINQKLSPSNSDGEGSYQNSDSYSTPPVRKRKFTNPIVHESMNNSLESTSGNPSLMKDEEWEVFGKAIGLQLRDLDKKQLTIAQKMISDAIYYAKFGLLTPNSYINLGNPPT